VKFYILNILLNNDTETVRYSTLAIYSFILYIIDAEIITGSTNQPTNNQPTRQTKARKYAAGMKERLPSKKVMAGLRKRYEPRPRNPGGDRT